MVRHGRLARVDTFTSEIPYSVGMDWTPEQQALARKYRRIDEIPEEERKYKCHTCHLIVDASPCPNCGGTDRLHVTEGWAFCRECHPKRMDAIAVVQWLGLAHDFRGACDYLNGGAMTPAGPVARRTPAEKPKARAISVQRG